MCVTYFRIYKAAVAHTKSLRLGAKQLTTNGSEGHGGQEVVLRMHRGGGTSSASAAGTPNGHSRLEIGRVFQNCENHIHHKSSCDICFWTSDPLIEIYY